MKALFILGAPASGKTTFIRKYIDTTVWKWMNIDTIAGLVAKHKGETISALDDETRNARYKEAFPLWRKKLSRHQNAGSNIMIDATGRNYERIAALKNELEENGYECALVFLSAELETSMSSNIQRKNTDQGASDIKYTEVAWHDTQLNFRKFAYLFNDWWHIKREDSEGRRARIAKEIDKFGSRTSRWKATDHSHAWVVNESAATDADLEACKMLVREAGDYLRTSIELGIYAYRATRSAPDSFFVRNTRTDRRPLDTKAEFHNLFNAMLASTGTSVRRDNCAFVKGSATDISAYGTPHIFIPLGKYEAVWSPYLADWTKDGSDPYRACYRGTVPVDEDGALADWNDQHAAAAARACSLSTNLWEGLVDGYCEVMVRCDRYAMIDLGLWSEVYEPTIKQLLSNEG